ncbi:hypothetical protein TNCV_2089551 [Trichonephila clavipes]|nr:hypothetical protein TNCV_2089551 [Trichonephila clavipes]
MQTIQVTHAHPHRGGATIRKRVLYKPAEIRRFINVTIPTDCWKTLVSETCQKLSGAVDTRRYPRAENWVWSDPEDHEERGSKYSVASTGGPHSDSFNDTSRRRRSNCSTNNFQTPCRSIS